MKKIFLSLAFTTLGLTAWAQDDNSLKVEIPLEGVLAPAQGFDDNDNVMVVAHGNLPNACYKLSETRIEPSTEAGTYRVRQFAERYPGDFCAQESKLPDYMKIPVPFTNEASVGALKQGAYRFLFEQEGKVEIQSRALFVSKATTMTIDSLPYAPVTNATTVEVIKKDDPLRITLNGVMNSSCMTLDEIVPIQKVNDVYVVLPTVKVKQGVACLQVLIPFKRTLDLGKMAPGHYLVHIRSMGGRAVNRVIRVLPD